METTTTMYKFIFLSTNNFVSKGFPGHSQDYYLMRCRVRQHKKKEKERVDTEGPWIKETSTVFLGTLVYIDEDWAVC